MNLWAANRRKLLLMAALVSLAGLAAGCGTASSSSGGAPSGTVPATVAPSSGTTTTSTPSAPPATSPPSGPVECTTSELRVTAGQPNGTAGTTYYSIDLTNISANTCFVQGYPGVSLVSAGNSSGSQIGADAKRNPIVTPQSIVLAPGKTAHAQLGVTQAGNFPPSKCGIVTAHWLKVFPPDQTVAEYVSFTTATCASTSQPTMRIGALTGGS